MSSEQQHQLALTNQSFKQCNYIIASTSVPIQILAPDNPIKYANFRNKMDAAVCCQFARQNGTFVGDGIEHTNLNPLIADEGPQFVERTRYVPVGVGLFFVIFYLF